jgi:hypothetical protein
MDLEGVDLDRPARDRGVGARRLSSLSGACARAADEPATTARTPTQMSCGFIARTTERKRMEPRKPRKTRKERGWLSSAYPLFLRIFSFDFVFFVVLLFNGISSAVVPQLASDAGLGSPLAADPAAPALAQPGFRLADDFAPDFTEALPDLADGPLALAVDAFARGAADLALAFAALRNVGRSDPDDFAFAPEREEDEDLDLPREDEPVEAEPGEIRSLMASSPLAPALTTASAPSTTVSPIERRMPPAWRPAPVAAFFAAFAAGLTAPAADLRARLSVPLLLLFLP